MTWGERSVKNKSNRTVHASCARCGIRFAEYVGNKAQWCEDCMGDEVVSTCDERRVAQ